VAPTVQDDGLPANDSLRHPGHVALLRPGFADDKDDNDDDNGAEDYNATDF